MGLEEGDGLRKMDFAQERREESEVDKNAK